MSNRSSDMELGTLSTLNLMISPISPLLIMPSVNWQSKVKVSITCLGKNFIKHIGMTCLVLTIIITDNRNFISEALMWIELLRVFNLNSWVFLKIPKSSRSKLTMILVNISQPGMEHLKEKQVNYQKFRWSVR